MHMIGPALSKALLDVHMVGYAGQTLLISMCRSVARASEQEKVYIEIGGINRA